MPHTRTLIREAFVTALTGSTPAGDNVFQARVYPMDADSLPGIIVYSNGETAEIATISYPRAQTRNATVSVQGYIKSITDYDTAADDLALAIEQAISADPTLGGICKDAALTNTEISMTGDGDKPVAVISLTFNVFYRTKENTPQTSF